MGVSVTCGKEGNSFTFPSQMKKLPSSDFDWPKFFLFPYFPLARLSESHVKSNSSENDGMVEAARQSRVRNVILIDLF